MSTDWTTHDAWRTMSQPELDAWFTRHVSTVLQQQGCKVEMQHHQGPQLRVLTPHGLRLSVHTMAQRQLGTLTLEGRHLQAHPLCWVAVGHLNPERPMQALLLPSLHWQHDELDFQQLPSERAVQQALAHAPHRLKLHQALLSKLLPSYTLSTRAALLSQDSKPLLSSQLLRTLLSDAFVLGNDRQRHAQLRRSGLSAAQQLLALEVVQARMHGPARYSEITDVCEALNRSFRWHSSSEDPLMISACILYLLERTGQSLAWLERAWLLAELEPR